jgi:multidrug efflux system outer membrane protein
VPVIRNIYGVRYCIWLLALIASLLALAGCAHPVAYQRPPVTLPDTYRGAPDSPPTSAVSLADQKWAEVFKDDQLQSLIGKAIQGNYDVRIAATHILEAEQQVTIARADQYPTVNGSFGGTVQRAARAGIIPAYSFAAGQLLVSGAWNPDFWGRYKNATEAARANLLAAGWARQEVVSTLVANVATGYFSLRELDLEREISSAAVKSRKDSLELTETRETHGLASLLDVRQAEQLVQAAATQIPDLDRRIEQQENALSTLLGENPRAMVRGLKLVDQPQTPEVPAGVPSSLLERRPDVREVEEQLAAAGADLNVARAALLPTFSLTGSTGLQSSALNSILDPGAIVVNLAAGLTQPIFNAGKLKAQVRLAEAQQQELVLTYRKTILNALQSVSDSLVAYRKTREFRVEQQKLAEAARDAARLSNLRYNAGETDYLEVLTNETNALSADLGLAQARLNELLSLVQLYQALGGGWQGN